MILFQCWFGHSLRKYPLHDWSIEQKWISILLPLLILYNSKLISIWTNLIHNNTNLTFYEGLLYNTFFVYTDPLFSMIFLINSWVPGMIDAILQTTFLCAILMFWLCVYHGLRQVLSIRNFLYNSNSIGLQ